MSETVNNFNQALLISNIKDQGSNFLAYYVGQKQTKSCRIENFLHFREAKRTHRTGLAKPERSLILICSLKRLQLHLLSYKVIKVTLFVCE
jgi:hypothetical protein